MDYGLFKALQGVLFFGAVLAFGVWQLVSVKRSRHRSQAGGTRPPAERGEGVR